MSCTEREREEVLVKVERGLKNKKEKIGAGGSETQRMSGRKLLSFYSLFTFYVYTGWGGGAGGEGMFDDEFVCINMCCDVVVFKY